MEGSVDPKSVRDGTLSTVAGSYPARGGAAEGAPVDDFPQVFGKYVLLRPMARGGMGELFLAASGETGGFEKLCVVKKVLHELEDAGVRRRFLDEAKVVVRLNHTNLVQVFDAGRVNDNYYLAMELVEGKDLRAVWNRCAQLHRRIPVDFAVYVIRELCRGLDYVHDAMGLDLVHRDISPPNILVGYHGEVKITDFGLAKHAIKRELTSPGVVFGRYSYLSPEQARGLPADRRTDIYAAGIVLWEMLTGRQLFPADNRDGQGATLAVLRKPDIRRPSSLVPGIPAGLDDVVLKALAVEREERYQTAGAFRAALSEIISRHYPACDTDRVAAFMRDIFQRERKLEQNDYRSYASEDFSRIRAQAQEVPVHDTMSISDSMVLDAKESSIPLNDSDIVELEGSIPGRQIMEAPSHEVLEELAEERVGLVIGRRYRIESLIGVGGMGAVYKAKHLALGKSYALKILHDVYGRDPDIIDRFMREARAATQTGHPNIIDVNDIGTVGKGGDLYYVMELLDGTNLHGVIKEDGALATRRAVHIARQICRALAAAHEAGIIHRDLKSENIVLVSKGNDPDFVKVLDFGICKQVDRGSSARTTPGMVMGSPDYMAPEQAAGEDATEKSDIYALGTILFEMLAGKLPFKGRNAIDVLMQKGARPAPHLQDFRQDVPMPLMEIVGRCLDRDPANRPESMKSLEYELTRAVDGRASAVAAAMGIRIPQEDMLSATNPPQALAEAAAQALAERAARAAANEAARGDDEEDTEEKVTEVFTVHDQAARSTAAGDAAASRTGDAAQSMASASASGHRSVLGGAPKALLFVVLGGALAAGVLFTYAPHLLSSGEDAATKAVEPAEDSAAAVVAEDQEGEPEEDETGAEPAVGETEGAPDEVDPSEQPAPNQPPPTPDIEHKPDALSLVAMAEAALEHEQWREPAEGSLAMAMTKLALVDPGNEALLKFKREAEAVLLPRGDKALKRKRWQEAVDAYRDLLAVWPDHNEARTGLIKSLRGMARVLRQHRDHEGALAAADELLNLQPDNFVALKLRADSLASLDRWEDAVAAYRAAMREKPRHKDVRKNYWKARKMAAKQEKKKN
jgi:serine/threonine protein kinase/tetratricopeptide (TPR) repeat protein